MKPGRKAEIKQNVKIGATNIKEKYVLLPYWNKIIFRNTNRNINAEEGGIKCEL